MEKDHSKFIKKLNKFMRDLSWQILGGNSGGSTYFWLVETWVRRVL
jgi:hypothetical protein